MKNSRKYMSDKYLLLFFVLTLLWTWICGFIPVIFDFTGTPAGTFLFYFGGGAPSVVALFLVFFTYPKEKIKDYVRSDGTIELNTIPGIDMYLAFIINPRNPKFDLPFGIYQSLK